MNLAVVQSATSGPPISNAWLVRPRQARSRHISSSSWLRAFRSVPSGVGVCAHLRAPRPQAPSVSGPVLKTDSKSLIGYSGMRKAPRGGRLREVAPVGGVVVTQTKAIPVPRQRRLPTTWRRLLPIRSLHAQPRADFTEHARRIAGSSSGHTAGGRGFRTY